PPPPAGFGADVAPPPPPGFGPTQASFDAPAPLPMDFDAPPPPAGFGADVAPPPPPGFGPTDQGAVPPPPGYGPTTQVQSNEVFGALQEMSSLIAPEDQHPEPEEETRFLAGTGTDRTSYAAVPPITPDFFARASNKSRK
ncbi:MAG: hypothetical protein ACRDVW_04775, partial [Acidimicrobiales bacterium]